MTAAERTRRNHRNRRKLAKRHQKLSRTTTTVKTISTAALIQKNSKKKLGLDNAIDPIMFGQRNRYRHQQHGSETKQPTYLLHGTSSLVCHGRIEIDSSPPTLGTREAKYRGRSWLNSILLLEPREM